MTSWVRSVVAGFGCLLACNGSDAGRFGEVLLRGDDTAVIGTSFEPSASRVFAGPPDTDVDSVATWNRDAGGRQVLEVDFDVDGSLIALRFLSEPSGAQTESRYAYGASCDPTCEGVAVDLVAQTVTFEGAPVDPESVDGATNRATAPLVLDGTLRYD
ncbi:MAG: hypothetical protein AAGF92_08670 [Myxococcota bacterium]